MYNKIIQEFNSIQAVLYIENLINKRNKSKTLNLNRC
jgi:hypothetical protein